MIFLSVHFSWIFFIEVSLDPFHFFKEVIFFFVIVFQFFGEYFPIFFHVIFFLCISHVVQHGIFSQKVPRMTKDCGQIRILVFKSFPVCFCSLEFHKFARYFTTSMIQDNYETVILLFIQGIVIISNITNVTAQRLNHDRLVLVYQRSTLLSLFYIKNLLFIFDFLHGFRIKEFKN